MLGYYAQKITNKPVLIYNYYVECSLWKLKEL
jgi:hypothetical protein